MFILVLWILINFIYITWIYLSEYNFINWESESDIDDCSAPATNKFFNVIIVESEDRMQRNLRRCDVTHISIIFRNNRYSQEEKYSIVLILNVFYLHQMILADVAYWIRCSLPERKEKTVNINA